MTKLYELKNEFKALNALVENGDLLVDDIADTVEALELETADKIKGCLMARQNLLSQFNAVDDEMQRLSNIQTSTSIKINSIEEYIKSNMIDMNMDKIDVDLFKVTIRKPTLKLGSLNEDKIPSRYFEVVPETKKLNKRALLSDAKKEAIEGVELINSERAITIK